MQRAVKKPKLVLFNFKLPAKVLEGYHRKAKRATDGNVSALIRCAVEAYKPNRKCAS